MQSVSRLRELLVTVLDTGLLDHGEQELFDELMVQKPRLLRLLDVGPRNAAEQKEIESGMCLPVFRRLLSTLEQAKRS